MQSVVFLLLRRLRTPLIVLISVYAVSILGLVLIPGQDAAGQPWRMDFFHAFYFVSFMGTTIGFGELPHPFTDAQRLWTIGAIYATVIAWLYGIGALLRLVQDPLFQRVVDHAGFSRAVRRIGEPFYLVCGYGDTGRLLVRALAERGLRTVVIDQRQRRIESLEMRDLPVYVPGYCADATTPDNLISAGLKRPNCAGVIALTDVDHANLTIAITCKLLAPKLAVIARAQDHDTQANMASFGTDYIINPFDTFADDFALASRVPSMHLLYDWITSTARTTQLAEPLQIPTGRWVVCGYGRFGKALHRVFGELGCEVQIVEAEPHRTAVPDSAVIGRGTEAHTLHAAAIERAVGIIAGTDDDANNLSILMTAKELNPDLFTVARQNESRNQALFNAAKPGLVMQRSQIVARKVLALIMTPLLPEFLDHMYKQDKDWANVLVAALSGAIEGYSPETWMLIVNSAASPALMQHLRENREICLSHLCTDPTDHESPLPCLPLLLHRASGSQLRPAPETPLEPGDRVLFAGRASAADRMYEVTRDYNLLACIYSGTQQPAGLFWRWLMTKLAR